MADLQTCLFYHSQQLRAKIEQLRRLVKDAYMEAWEDGYRAGHPMGANISKDDCWAQSDARRELEDEE